MVFFFRFLHDFINFPGKFVIICSCHISKILLNIKDVFRIAPSSQPGVGCHHQPGYQRRAGAEGSRGRQAAGQHPQDQRAGLQGAGPSLRGAAGQDIPRHAQRLQGLISLSIDKCNLLFFRLYLLND